MTPERLAEIHRLVTPSAWTVDTTPGMAIRDLLADRDALVAAGDVLVTRLDESNGYLNQVHAGVGINPARDAVRAWLAVAHPNGEGHKP